MREYVVYREGWDPTNQDPAKGLPVKMPVARIVASSPEEACQAAAAQVSVTGKQRLTAEPADVLDAHEAAMNASPRSVPADQP
jgi:hypothetical protein